MSKKSIRFWGDHMVRAVWDEENNKWWFSVLDVVGAINKQDDYQKTRNYWKYLKARLKKENDELVSTTTQLKFRAADGKLYKTDSLDAEGIKRLAQKIHNDESAAFLEWFVYGDNSIDGRSRKQAYTLWESNLISDKEVGTTKALQKIHAYLFGGLYDFAGKIRTKTIAKGNTLFCLAEHLHGYLQSIDNLPENTFDEIIDKYCDMNAAHPFMEGNGRSTRIWLDMILKKRLGQCIDWSKVGKREYLDAMIKSHTDNTTIKTLLRSALTNRINDREIFMKGIDYSYYYEQEE